MKTDRQTSSSIVKNIKKHYQLLSFTVYSAKNTRVQMKNSWKNLLKNCIVQTYFPQLIYGCTPRKNSGNHSFFWWYAVLIKSKQTSIRKNLQFALYLSMQQLHYVVHTLVKPSARRPAVNYFQKSVCSTYPPIYLSTYFCPYAPTHMSKPFKWQKQPLYKK